MMLWKIEKAVKGVGSGVKVSGSKPVIICNLLRSAHTHLQTPDSISTTLCDWRHSGFRRRWMDRLSRRSVQTDNGNNRQPRDGSWHEN
ncbi:unnamed protein product [Pleuronectes platessa]|uniref:Uncharacterized protein n=1 Tax=Pleuronectes platessa TaxID=8262 RepID=A0A9N7V5N8_PLEPL|nr:unnamed protein product [Pleuronectes platessa]